MGRPFRPIRELEGHLQRGELDFAIALARIAASERTRPLELELTVRFLPPQHDDQAAGEVRPATRWAPDNRVDHICAQQALSRTLVDRDGLVDAPGPLAGPEQAVGVVSGGEFRRVPPPGPA